MPGGDATTTYRDESSSVSLTTGFALGADVGFWPRPGLRLALSGQLQTGLETDLDGPDVTSRLATLGGRLEGHRPVSPGAHLYAFAQPGYSHMTVRPTNGGESDTGDGFALGVGAGARFTLNPQLGAFIELGYQWSTHRFSRDTGPDPRIDVSLMLLRGGLTLNL